MYFETLTDAPTLGHKTPTVIFYDYESLKLNNDEYSIKNSNAIRRYVFGSRCSILIRDKNLPSIYDALKAKDRDLGAVSLSLFLNEYDIASSIESIGKKFVIAPGDIYSWEVESLDDSDLDLLLEAIISQYDDLTPYVNKMELDFP